MTLATPKDAQAISALLNAAADDLTARFGRGHWSSHLSERGVLLAMRRGRVYFDGAFSTFTLSTRKPWAIDRSHLTPVATPLYLTSMAVAPARQRRGLGRAAVADAIEVARAWPAQAIALDAYDAAAGAGPFYARCGFAERGRVSYRGTPLIYYEMLL